MDRRKFLVGAGSAAIGGSALLATGAFSRVASQRDVTIQVADDENAYLRLAKCHINDRPTRNSSYVTDDGKGHMKLEMSSTHPDSLENDGDLGTGVNSDSTTVFDNVFEICNQGKKQTCVWIEYTPLMNGEGDPAVEFYWSDHDEVSPANPINEDYSPADSEDEFPTGEHLPVGDCFCIGVRTNTTSLPAYHDETKGGHSYEEGVASDLEPVDADDDNAATTRLIKEDEIVIHADTRALCWEYTADEEHLAYVPNASDGTLSKLTFEADPLGVETTSINLIDDYDDELTNRMVIDPDGNPWVLNSGQGLDPPDDQDRDSQGQVIKVNRETDETTAYDIGAVGDRPRAIEWVDGKLWVGFYDADPEQYLLELDPEGLEDDEVAEDEGDAGVVQKVGLGDEVRPYTLVYDSSRETLWLSSRPGSRMTTDENDSASVYSIDPDTGAVSMENSGLVGPYFIALDDQDTVWVSDYPGGNPGEGTLARYDGAWDTVTVNVGTGDSGNFRGLVADENDDIWVGSTDGWVYQLDSDDDYSVKFSADIGTDSVGIGIDPGGRIWVIDREDHVMRRLSDPLDEDDPVDDEETIDLGLEPYAYGDFVVEEHKKT